MLDRVVVDGFENQRKPAVLIGGAGDHDLGQQDPVAVDEIERRRVGERSAWDVGPWSVLKRGDGGSGDQGLSGWIAALAGESSAWNWRRMLS